MPSASPIAMHFAVSTAGLHYSTGTMRPAVAIVGEPERAGKVDIAAKPTRESEERAAMIRKLVSGKYRLYSRKKNPKTARRRNLGTFASRAAAEKHERAVQYFKRD
jgi:hypothetical protein